MVALIIAEGVTEADVNGPAILVGLVDALGMERVGIHNKKIAGFACHLQLGGIGVRAGVAFDPVVMANFAAPLAVGAGDHPRRPVFGGEIVEHKEEPEEEMPDIILDLVMGIISMEPPRLSTGIRKRGVHGDIVQLIEMNATRPNFMNNIEIEQIENGRPPKIGAAGHADSVRVG